MPEILRESGSGKDVPFRENEQDKDVQAITNMLNDSFYEDSDLENADRLECLSNLDELLDDEDVLSNVEEGEIVEVEIEKDDVDITYEGCGGLIITLDFVQDNVVHEISSDDITKSVDKEPELTKPDTPCIVNVEPLLYKDTEMTKEKWLEVVKN
ncbi:hypothetical protein L1987_15170 [Smallanthus sonchifolius]|uniref:Uncharacterized protein n=1 Tax=Smallanthus sonchifolius TaxID=185202 RepID=A0ACB9J4Q8_9ASTR|nr:hypothetical protein L1987_15170 [Smallanthus sonchifolius]